MNFNNILHHYQEKLGPYHKNWRFSDLVIMQYFCLSIRFNTNFDVCGFVPPKESPKSPRQMTNRLLTSKFLKIQYIRVTLVQVGICLFEVNYKTPPLCHSQHVLRGLPMFMSNIKKIFTVYIPIDSHGYLDSKMASFS